MTASAGTTAIANGVTAARVSRPGGSRHTLYTTGGNGLHTDASWRASNWSVVLIGIQAELVRPLH